MIWLSFYEILAHTIQIKVFGKKFPVAANETEKGRAKNRRVEIWLFNPDWNSSPNCSPKGATVIALNRIDRKGSVITTMETEPIGIRSKSRKKAP